MTTTKACPQFCPYCGQGLGEPHVWAGSGSCPGVTMELERFRQEAFAAGWLAAHRVHGGLLISHGVTDWTIGYDQAWRDFPNQLTEKA